MLDQEVKRNVEDSARALGHLSENNRTLVIAILDKEWPPRHSFVDGMLAGELAHHSDIQVRLMVSQGSVTQRAPTQYGFSACLPMLYQRRRIGRILNVWVTWRLLHYQIKRSTKRKRPVVLFVRNDPFFLIASIMLRGKVARIIFQSSFPHESHSVNKIQGILARSIYRLAGRWVDGVVGVSPEGVRRIRSVLGRDLPSLFIPLLSDLPRYDGSRAFNRKSADTIRFVYIGSHADARELDTVFEAIVNCMQKDVSASFHFIGATHREYARFCKLPGLEALIKSGVIEIQSPVSRNEIPKILGSCHVGLSLIPPSAMYVESSPTKLAEYMGAGLAILASKGIPLQEQFVQASDGGVLVDWDVEAISHAIKLLATDTAYMREMGRKSCKYAARELQYRRYVGELRNLMFGNPPEK